MNTYNRFKKCLAVGVLFSLTMGLVGCNSMGPDGMSSGGFDAGNTPDAVPRKEALNKYANRASYVVHGKRYYVLQNAKGYDKVGSASWYGTKFHGKRTSIDETYNMYSMTAASTTLPIPSYARVTNLENGRTTVVRVNDRGPFHSNRIIDLSYAAAKKLGYTGSGTAKVRVTAIDTSSPSSTGFFAQNEVATPAAVPEAPKFGIPHFSNHILIPAPKSIQLAQANSSPVYLQVGSFHTRSSAENMSKRIKTKLTTPLQVAIRESMSSGSRVYRVNVGPLKDPKNPEQIVRLLAKNGFDKATIIRG